MPALLNQLGNSFLHRFECTGDLQDISEAIRSHQRAVQLTPDGHADLSSRLNNLGMSFSHRFERTGDEDDISEAIRSQQHAVQLTPDGHANLASWFNSLGISFLRRFESTGDMDNISEAIQCHQRAVQLTPDGHAGLPGRLNNLGNSFLRRFERTGDLEDNSAGIQNHQRAIQLTPDRDADLPGRLNNLGMSLSFRFERSKNLDDISEAIRNQQRAIQISPDGHPDLPACFNNLGDSFASRFECTGAHESLLSAVSNYRRCATSSTGPPSLRLNAAKRWATLSRQPSFPSSELLEAYACIIQLLSIISGLENTVRRRHEALLNSSQLSIAASAAAVSLGCYDKALEWLVEGRCIVWNQINKLRTPVDELRSYDPALADRLSILSRELENAGLRMDSRRGKTDLSMNEKMSLEDRASTHLKHAKEWEQLLATIRNISGFEYFLQPRKCADIMHALPEEGPIVIINIHINRCDALALKAGADEPMHIPLPKFSHQEAERLAKGLYNNRGVRSRLGMPLDDDDSLFSHLDIPDILNVLWFGVVSPILEALDFSVRHALALSIDDTIFTILSRYLIPLQSCHVYGGAQPALLASFQSTRQASMSRTTAILLDIYCPISQSRLTFRPLMSSNLQILSINMATHPPDC